MTLLPLYSSTTSLSMQVNMYACSESILHRIWVWTNKFLVSARSASIIFVNSRIRRSLDADSSSTLVHAFVTLRVDYCNAILAGAPKTTRDRLQRVLNAAARVVSDTKKFDQGLSRLMHQELHWLDIPERVKYKLGMLTHRCLLGKAPATVAFQSPKSHDGIYAPLHVIS